MATDSDFEIQFFESILTKAPDYAEVVEILGTLYTQTGQLEEGLKMDRKLAKLVPDNPTVHYNLACSLALKCRKQDATKALRKAIELGYRDLEWIQEDPDLQNLNDYGPFEELLMDLEELLIDEANK